MSSSLVSLSKVLMKMAELSSIVTHGAKACVDACRYFALLICGAMNATPKEQLLSTDYYSRYLPSGSDTEIDNFK